MVGITSLMLLTTFMSTEKGKRYTKNRYGSTANRIVIVASYGHHDSTVSPCFGGLLTPLAICVCKILKNKIGHPAQHVTTQHSAADLEHVCIVSSLSPHFTCHDTNSVNYKYKMLNAPFKTA